MDSSPHNNNWLGFSLSNHPHFHSHNPLSLLHSFSSSNPVSVVDTNRAINQDVQSCGTTDLAMFTGGGGPKLEDFLGSGGSTSVTTTTNAPVLSFPQFQSEATPVTLSDSEIYDSELKTIAASFLRGFNTIDNHDKQVEALKQQAMAPLQQTPTRKAVDTFGQRTSIYRGVTRHRWTGRYEAHLWDNSCRREGQSRKGRQVYLGGYDKEDKAAKAYDLAALKYWGPTTTTNFPVSDYEKELEEMKNMTRQEFVASLRRKSSGFSRGASIYRGVTRHHQHGRWQARIGRVAGNKDLYLGTFSTQEEAAEAYDIAAIKFRGLNAVTNFEISRYDVKSIANSNLPIGGISTKPKNCSELASDSKSIDGNQLADDRDLSNSASSVTFTSQPTSSTLHFGIPIKPDPSTDYWSNIFGFQNPSPSTTSLNNNKYSKNPTQHLAIAPTSSLFHCSTNDNNNHGYGSGSGSGSGLIRNSSFPELNMDFSATTSTTSVSESNNGIFNTGYSQENHQPQQQQSSNGNVNGNGNSNDSVVEFGTNPIALNGNDSNETSSGYGSWMGQSVHTSFHPKPSLYQTPIFGIE